MDQYDFRHWQFPRTTRQAFGEFMPMRKDFRFREYPIVKTEIFAALAIAVIVAACAAIS